MELVHDGEYFEVYKYKKEYIVRCFMPGNEWTWHASRSCSLDFIISFTIADIKRFKRKRK